MFLSGKIIICKKGVCLLKKIKITREQEDAIKQARSLDFEDILRMRKTKNAPFVYRSLDDLSVNELGLVFFNLGSYEVINELKEGDTLYYPEVCKLGKVQGDYVHWDDNVKNDLDYSLSLLESGDIRFATPNDIERSKEKRFWIEHGREPWELKQGDIIMGERRQFYEVTGTPMSNGSFYYTGNDNYDFDIAECRDRNWEVVCFEEDRLD